MSRRTQNTASFLTGAGIGALAMYFLDPQLGTKRRGRIGQAASGAMHGTQEAVSSLGQTASSAWESVREKAGDIGQAASTRAALIGPSLAEIGHRISERMPGMSRQTGRGFTKGLRQLAGYTSAAGLAKQVRQVPERARQLSEQMPGRLRQYRPQRVGQPTVRSSAAQTLFALGCIALGMGIMYAFDPTAGQRRRAMARDRLRSSFGDMTTRMRKTSRDAWNRTTGAVSELRHRTIGRQVSDVALVERIRSEMGHCISDPQAIEVSAHKGRVTLSGMIPANEIDSLMKCVWSVPGVVELINRLEARQPAPAISDLPGEQTTS